MGRTLPTATMLFIQEQDNFSQFRRALRRSDQLALDDLFVMARNHTAAAAYAANAVACAAAYAAYAAASCAAERRWQAEQIREIISFNP